MPPEVRSLYIEAADIFDRSPRGATALLRLAVEELCRHLGKSGKIDKMIGDLVTDGLEVPVQQALDALRVIGNNAVHPGQIDVDDNNGVAKSLFRLLNLIIERRISEPNEIAEIFSELPAGARDSIAKRDQNAVAGRDEPEQRDPA